jgi:entericidin B
MTAKAISSVAAIILVAGLSAGCANTIRGMGQDTSNTVQATQDAGRTVERSTY